VDKATRAEALFLLGLAPRRPGFAITKDRNPRECLVGPPTPVPRAFFPCQRRSEALGRLRPRLHIVDVSFEARPGVPATPVV
jgi:hypothetical protein